MQHFVHVTVQKVCIIKSLTHPLISLDYLVLTNSCTFALKTIWKPQFSSVGSYVTTAWLLFPLCGLVLDFIVQMCSEISTLWLMQECIKLAREHVKHGSRILILVTTEYEKVHANFVCRVLKHMQMNTGSWFQSYLVTVFLPQQIMVSFLLACTIQNTYIQKIENQSPICLRLFASNTAHLLHIKLPWLASHKLGILSYLALQQFM